MKKNSINDLFVSVILIASKNANKNIKALNQISEILKKNYTNYEIICMSEDAKFISGNKLNEILQKLPCIRVVHLAGNNSTDIKIFAGLESAIGDSVVILLAGIDPPNKLTDFIKYNQKYNIVFGISNSKIRNGLINEMGSKLFYWYNSKFLGINIPNNSTYYSAFSRMAVNSLTQNGRNIKHIRHLAKKIGLEVKYIKYKNLNINLEKKKIKDLALSALELSTNYSNHPIRFISWLGFFAAFINFLYMIYILLIFILKDKIAEGWFTTSMQLSIMFFLLFAIIAILSEYIGRILQELRNEQPYHIIDEQNSKVSIANTTRRNIEK